MDSYGVRLVNIHSKLVGAIDGLVLSLSAAVTIALLFVLLSSPAERAERYTVTIEQLS